MLAQLELLRQRRREAAASGLVNHMDSCRFDDQDFERFSELWEQFTAQDVSQKLKPPPSRPTPQVESLIQSCIDGMKELPRPEPTWVKGVIDNRDLFVDCFIFNDDGSLMPPVVFRIVLATQNPRRVVFMQCRRRDLPIEIYAGMPAGVLPLAGNQCFDYMPLMFYDHENVPLVNDNSLSVATDLIFSDGGLQFIGDAYGFESFVRFHPRGRYRSQDNVDSRVPRKGKLSIEMVAMLMLEFPWLTMAEIEAMLTTTPAKFSGAPSGSSGGPTNSIDSDDDSLPEDVVARVEARLDDVRADIAVPPEEVAYFKTKVLGGVWAQQKKGVPVSDIACQAASESTKLWCSATGFPRQRSFAVSKYGQEASRVLAEEVCRMGNYYMNLWTTAGNPAPFTFGTAHENYRHSHAFQDWLQAQPMNSHSYQEALKIKALCPSRIPG